MQELWRLLTSPRHLLVFEAAARLGSFTLAAKELNVQQPAVSAAIKQLETSLDVLLFRRGHRKVELTSAGERLLADVTIGLDHILNSVRAIHQRSRAKYVTLSASTAFAYYWMVPRLQRLHQRHPNVDLRLQTSDREPDVETEAIDLAVRRGLGDWPGCDSALLAHEVICPISSPKVVETASLKTLSELMRQPLIHLEEPVRERPSWRQWFDHFGVTGDEQTGGLRLNDYALVLQAAIASEGFAMGWQHLTGRLVDQGLLSAHSDWSWHTGSGFYLVWSNATPLSAEGLLVRDWMITEASAAA
ncbi:MAG: LysR substrate-binding domain-containing protein [Pseudomonadota bacterium]